ncbi:hypothetical protein [Micromonospora luteifusca]|uniref:hypothetical protein n=1 Tax=Micromonospora luteifusca TaxID=709860 RepID=UPI0033B5DE8F
MTHASDPVLTAGRIEQLKQYMAEHILSPSGACVCRRLSSCRESALGGRRSASRPEAAFAAGQLSHVGHHYNLVLDGVPARTLVIAMETGRTRGALHSSSVTPR